MVDMYFIAEIRYIETIPTRCSESRVEAPRMQRFEKTQNALEGQLLEPVQLEIRYSSL